MKCKLQTQKKEHFQGLYQSDYEHDACGVGMVVNIHGGKSHELVDNALKVLENMEHRGAGYRYPTSLFCYRVSPCPKRVSTAQVWFFCLRTRKPSSRY